MRFNLCKTPMTLVGYEPAGLTVHPPPKKKMIEGEYIFSHGCLVEPKIFVDKSAGVTMTLFRDVSLETSHGRDACPISLWGLGSRTSAGNLVPRVTFGFAGPETWPAVSCGLVTNLA